MRWLHALASHRLTAYVLFAYAAFLALLAAWGVRIPAEVVRRIAVLWPFDAIYIFGAVHLALCLLFFWPAVRGRLALRAPGSESAVPLVGQAEALFAEEAKAHGFARLDVGDGSTAFVRHRWSPLGTLLFHGAILLVPLAYGVSRSTRLRGEAWLVEGHTLDLAQAASYARLDGNAEGLADLGPLPLQVEGIEAQFWGERLYFTDLRALVRLGESAEVRSEWLTLAQPLAAAGLRLSLTGYNYTPALEVRDPAGALVFSGDLSLKLFPPGLEDSFRLPTLPHRLFVRLYPDADGPGGERLNRGFSLARPWLHVAVLRGKTLVTHAWLRPGEVLAFDGYTARFPFIRRGGELVVHRDLGEPILWLALLLALGGAAWRILWPTSRVWLQLGNEGARGVARDDAFAAGAGQRLLEAWRGRGAGKR